jgi:hypothetical protein
LSHTVGVNLEQIRKAKLETMAPLLFPGRKILQDLWGKERGYSRKHQLMTGSVLAVLNTWQLTLPKPGSFHEKEETTPPNPFLGG